MTMRKHKNVRNFDRPIPKGKWLHLEGAPINMPTSATPKQYLVLHEAFGKLLGVKSIVEAMIARSQKAMKRGLDRYEDTLKEKTTQDHERIARAAADRAVKRAKRTKAYAKCIAGNWNKTLTELPHYQGVRVAKNHVVDKLFVKMHAPSRQSG